MTDAIVDVERLSKTYRSGLWRRRRVDALRQASFQVGRGEIFGLLGPNGAGKTTLIKILLGLVRKSSGAARILGRAAGDRRARRRVGYLPEHHRIPRHHTGLSALMYYGGLSGLSRREVRRRATGLLELVGLDGWGTVSVRKYSKGMQQRLGLAQAMLHEPDLLVLDEPTDGVDPVGRSEMRGVLQRLKAEGKTVFLNSHLLQEVELVCDRVAILQSGEVRAVGRVAELTHRPQAEVVFDVVGDRAAVDAALDRPGIEVRRVTSEGPDRWLVEAHLADAQANDAAVDALRAAGLSLRGLHARRQSLEEAFLEIVRGGADA